MPPRTYKLRLDTEQLDRWQKSADKVGLKLAEWMRRELDDVASGRTVYVAVPPIHIEHPREFIKVEGIGHENRDHQDGAGVPDVPVAGRGAGPSRRIAPVPVASAGAYKGTDPLPDFTPDVVDDKQTPVSIKSQRPLSGMASDSHDVDCQCGLCSFKRQVLNKEQKPAPSAAPKKKRR